MTEADKSLQKVGSTRLWDSPWVNPRQDRARIYTGEEITYS
jgi:hypothetical protein